MAENGGDLPDDQRCKRNDGRKWRCGRPAFEGRTLCEIHILKGRIRQHKEPVPDNSKIETQNPPKREIRANPKRGKNVSDISSNLPRKRRKGKQKDPQLKSKSKSSVDLSEDLDDSLKKGDLQLDLIGDYLNQQIEKKKGKQPQKDDTVKELKYGRLEISQSSSSTTLDPKVNKVKIGVPASTSVLSRFFRSKNIDPIPTATVQILPNIKDNVKASTKKCHWCSMCSYRVLVKCLTSKKHFFCEDCIHQRYQGKIDVKKQCPVCSGTCNCKVCERSKEVKTKDLVVYNGEGKFDKSQQLLYMINLLLPLLEQINQEKDNEMDIEAKIKGKDLEKSAKEIVSNSNFTNFINFDSSYCSLCDENDKNGDENEGLYFSINQDFGDKNLEHFTKHWVKGQPLIIRDVIKTELELTWDPILIFGVYLGKCAKSLSEKLKNCSDWCEVEMGRKQIFMGGKTHANACTERLKLKIWLSSRSFQEHFPCHYDAVMHALPLQQYFNPLMGILNLAANVPSESQNVDFGPFVNISYGKPQDFMGGDFVTKICYHAYDMVNILVHATELVISDKKLNKLKILLNRYNSQDQNESPRNNKIKDKIDEAREKSSFSSEITQQSSFSVFSDDSSSCDSDDSSCNQQKVVDTCGAHWDIFRREDVSKLVQFLKKYSNELNCSPEKVVHPLLDESFYLDAFHKKYLKDEFDVEPWTFEQHIGEAVIVPAGCPYQIKKIKSCLNVVLEFVSPESASIGIKLSDEIDRLPVNHKAKGKMIDVKKMTIHSVNAAVEEILKVRQAEIGDKVVE